MIGIRACEWGVCNLCAAKCEHEYIRGPIRGGGTDIGVGDFCEKCGQGRPLDQGELPKTVAEHHQAAKEELGLIILPRGTIPDLTKLPRKCRFPKSTSLPSSFR